LSGNVTTQQQLCEYMDDWISEVLTGQEPARSSGGAVAAASKERKDVRQDLTQADSDLLSETLNETLIAWICEFNGLEPCHVYRNIQEEEDTKTLAEADNLVKDLGFELDEASARAKYGEGWHKRSDPLQVPPVVASSQTPLIAPPAPATASFAEGSGGAKKADVVAALSESLDAAAAPQWQRVVDDLQVLVNEASDAKAMQASLLSAYAGLDTEDLTRLMAAAFVLAELKGMDAARTAGAHA